MGQKVGMGCCAPLFEEDASPSNAMSPGPRPTSHQVASWSIHPSLGPDDIVLDGIQLPSHGKGAQQPHIWCLRTQRPYKVPRPMCIVAKRSPITATAEQLLNFDLPNITVQSIKLLSNKGPKATYKPLIEPPTAKFESKFVGNCSIMFLL